MDRPAGRGVVVLCDRVAMDREESIHQRLDELEIPTSRDGRQEVLDTEPTRSTAKGRANETPSRCRRANRDELTGPSGNNTRGGERKWRGRMRVAFVLMTWHCA